MAKKGKHEADIVDPRAAIEYWRERAVRQGPGYVSRGGKNTGDQVRILKPTFKKLLDGKRFRQGLDYGCGGGRFTPLVANYCDKVLGVDLVGRFRKDKPKNVKFHKLDYPVDILLADNSVDLVFAIMVFQHITGAKWFDEVTTEIRRVLAPGATVLIVDDVTATAGHMRPRSRKELCDALGVKTALNEVELSIDKSGTHQLIFGQTAE
jgi:SAM-dependent methyltransferase